MRFVPSNSMKIDLLPEQEAYLSTKDTICQVIRENPDSVFAFDILQDEILIGFALLHRFEPSSFFLWDYAIDWKFQNQGLGTEALKQLIKFMHEQYGLSVMTTTYIWGNTHAKTMYEKVGFVQTDVVDEPECHEVNMIFRYPSSTGIVERSN